MRGIVRGALIEGSSQGVERSPGSGFADIAPHAAEDMRACADEPLHAGRDRSRSQGSQSLNRGPFYGRSGATQSARYGVYMRSDHSWCSLRPKTLSAGGGVATGAM